MRLPGASELICVWRHLPYFQKVDILFLKNSSDAGVGRYVLHGCADDACLDCTHYTPDDSQSPAGRDRSPREPDRTEPARLRVDAKVHGKPSLGNRIVYE
jgi:hypothetical protein